MKSKTDSSLFGILFKLLKFIWDNIEIPAFFWLSSMIGQTDNQKVGLFVIFLVFYKIGTDILKLQKTNSEKLDKIQEQLWK